MLHSLLIGVIWFLLVLASWMLGSLNSRVTLLEEYVESKTNE